MKSGDIGQVLSPSVKKFFSLVFVYTQARIAMRSTLMKSQIRFIQWHCIIGVHRIFYSFAVSHLLLPDHPHWHLPWAELGCYIWCGELLCGVVSTPITEAPFHIPPRCCHANTGSCSRFHGSPFPSHGSDLQFHLSQVPPADLRKWPMGLFWIQGKASEASCSESIHISSRMAGFCVNHEIFVSLTP